MVPTLFNPVIFGNFKIDPTRSEIHYLSHTSQFIKIGICNKPCRDLVAMLLRLRISRLKFCSSGGNLMLSELSVCGVAPLAILTLDLVNTT